MEKLDAMRWLDKEILNARACAKKTALIQNFTYFGTTFDIHDEVYYDVVIPTKVRGDLYWWRMLIKPSFSQKQKAGTSNIDITIAIIDDNIYLHDARKSRWELITSNENVVMDTIPYMEDWNDVFTNASDIIDELISKKEGTEMQESMSLEKARMILENAGCKLIRPKMNEWAKITKDTPEELRTLGNEVNTKDENFYLWQWMFNNYNCDYARSYGPNAAYRKLIEEFRTHFDDGSECDPVYLVPDSYAEWEDRFGFAIDDTPPSEDWYL